MIDSFTSYPGWNHPVWLLSPQKRPYTLFSFSLSPFPLISSGLLTHLLTFAPQFLASCFSLPICCLATPVSPLHSSPHFFPVLSSSCLALFINSKLRRCFWHVTFPLLRITPSALTHGTSPLTYDMWKLWHMKTWCPYSLYLHPLSLHVSLAFLRITPSSTDMHVMSSLFSSRFFTCFPSLLLHCFLHLSPFNSSVVLQLHMTESNLLL